MLAHLHRRDGGGGYLSQLLNVSHRIKKQVREQTKSLQAATEESHRQRLRAEDLAKHKQNFLANMSHEIRTPMNGVLGVVQLLEEEDLSEKQKHYVKVIGDSGNLMIGILNDILDQSKIDAGKIIIQKEPCQIRNLLEDLCGMYKSAAQAKDLNLELLIDSNLPEYLEVDSMRLKQIISNLISNSMKFTDKGSIDISARMAGENFEIAVEDTGIGISKDILGVIFDEFTQADSSTTRNYGGTGLGLSISHKLLKLMGSELKVKSELGEGSRFFFEIKAEECLGMGPKEEILKAEVKLEDFYWPVTSRILVAEDNATNGMIITSLLKKLGISSDIAENGQLALELFKKKSYDVILMDCQMPVMDGYDATRKIRAGDQIQPFIVALTSNALPEDREKCIDVGMNEYLPKPLEIPSLLKVLVQAQEFLQKTS